MIPAHLYPTLKKAYINMCVRFASSIVEQAILHFQMVEDNDRHHILLVLETFVDYLCVPNKAMLRHLGVTFSHHFIQPLQIFSFRQLANFEFNYGHAVYLQFFCCSRYIREYCKIHYSFSYFSWSNILDFARNQILVCFTHFDITYTLKCNPIVQRNFYF